MKSRNAPLRRPVSGSPSDQAEACLRVSFEYLDWTTPGFFVHGFDEAFYRRLFECLQVIQASTREQIAEQTHPSLACKAIFKSTTGTQTCFPRSVIDRLAARLRAEQAEGESEDQALRVAKHAFEVSMGKNQGRLHGFLWNKSFNLVWIDPAHNLYPGRIQVRGHREVMQMKSGSHDEILRAREINLELVNEINRLQHDIDQLLAK